MNLNNNKLFEAVMATIIAISLIFFVSVAGGTWLWLFYPHIHALFPTAAENNIIASDLGWWDSVCIVWLFSTLTKNVIKQDSSK